MNYKITVSQGRKLDSSTVISQLLTPTSILVKNCIHNDKKIMEIILSTFKIMLQSNKIVADAVVLFLFTELKKIYDQLNLMRLATKSAKYIFHQPCWELGGVYFSYYIVLLSSDEISSFNSLEIVVNRIIKEYHPIVNPLISQYPMVQYSVVVAIQKISRTMAVSKAYTSIQLASSSNILFDLLDKSHSFKIITLCINWVIALPISKWPFTASQLLKSITKHTLHPNATVKKLVSTFLKNFITKQGVDLSSSDIQLLLNTCVLSFSEPSIRKEYIDIIGVLGPWITIRKFSKDIETQNFATHFDRLHSELMCMNSTSQPFSGLHFHKVMNHISQKSNEFGSPNWIVRLFLLTIGFSAGKNILDKNAKNEEKFMLQISEICQLDQTMIFWVLWECGRFCVNSRLRTTLGTAKELFESLEKVLALASNEEHCNSHSQTFSHFGFQPLLQFIDNLEKQICVATEGSSFFTFQKSSLTFFRNSNHLEIFHKMRELLVGASVASCSNADIIKHSPQRIQYLLSRKFEQENVEELEFCLLHLALSFSQLRDPDALEGLITLCHSEPVLKNLHLVSTDWIRATQLKANGKYERAVEYFKNIIKNLQNYKLSYSSVVTILDQITECYVCLGDWDEFEAWQDNLRVIREVFKEKNTRNYYSRALTPTSSTRYDVNYIKSLIAYDRGALEYSNSFLKLVSRISDSNSPVDVEKKCSYAILNFLLSSKLGIDSVSCNEELTSCQELLSKTVRVTRNIQEALPHLITLHSISLLENSSNFKHFSQTFDTSLHEVGSWMSVLRIRNFLNEINNTEHDEKLLLKIAKLSRKQSNFRLSNKVIAKAHKTHPILFEEAKLIRSSSQNPYKSLDAFTHLVSLMQRLKKEFCHRSFESSVFITLGNWIYKSKVFLQQNLSAPFIQDLLGESSKSFFSTFGSYFSSHNITECDKMVGYCYQQATNLDPKNLKSTFLYANWCYSQGKKAISQFSGKSVDKVFTVNEISLIEEIVNKNLGTEFEEDKIQDRICETIYKSIEKLINESHTEEDENEVNYITTIQQTLPAITSESLQQLISIHDSILKRLLFYYSLAVKEYFHSLILYGDNKLSKEGDFVITATLRLLQLLVNFGKSLEDDFTKNISETPPSVWRDITPQLFARLGHPETYVQERVTELITRIGKFFPHDIIYPVIVGCNGNPDQSSGFTLGRQFHNLRTILKSNYPELCDDVVLMLDEFSKLTMLWHETGIIMLNKIHSFDLNYRSNMVKDEIKRIIENNQISFEDKPKLILEKYSTIMKLVFVKLNEFLEIISKPYETPFEKMFQYTYKKRFEDALYDFQNPILSSNLTIDTKELWEPFQQMCVEFQKLKPQKLSDYCPKLTSRRSTAISMPGIELPYSAQTLNSIVTIHSFENRVDVLPSKTKPKKLLLLGSDGVKYPYLLKGREDLHLDERIMQFLGIVNKSFDRHKQTSSRQLSARKYAVIPIGERCGLIQWVDGVIPMLQTFKHWQRANAVVPNSDSGPPPNPAAVHRPVEMYFKKIGPKLTEKGYSMSNRKQWPLDLQKSVFAELDADIPSDLLAKEFWYSSSTTSSWWTKTQTFNRSVAVMSIVGYILGLGDRHLDNILVDFNTGEVIHIDYNICFERGVKLKVPERVPFRLTQIMQKALGISGVEGTFRVACYEVLRILRRNNEQLLTLLETFVYDPLVDWTSDREDNMIRNQIEMKVSADLLSSRLEGCNSSLSSVAPMFLEMLPFLHTLINEFLNYEKKKINLSLNQSELKQKVTHLNSSLTTENESLEQSKVKFQKLTAKLANTTESYETALSNLHELLKDNANTQDRFSKALERIRGGVVQLTNMHNAILHSLNHPQNQFLTNEDFAPISSTSYPLDYQKITAEYLNNLQRRDKHFLNATDILKKYQNLLLLLPFTEYISSNRCNEWIQWITKIVGFAKSDSLNELESTLSQLFHHFSVDSFGRVEAEKQKYYKRYLDDIDITNHLTIQDSQEEEQKSQLNSLCNDFNVSKVNVYANFNGNYLNYYLLQRISIEHNNLDKISTIIPLDNSSIYSSVIFVMLFESLNKISSLLEIYSEQKIDKELHIPDLDIDFTKSLTAALQRFQSNFTEILDLFTQLFEFKFFNQYSDIFAKLSLIHEDISTCSLKVEENKQELSKLHLNLRKIDLIILQLQQKIDEFFVNDEDDDSNNKNIKQLTWEDKEDIEDLKKVLSENISTKDSMLKKIKKLEDENAILNEQTLNAKKSFTQLVENDQKSQNNIPYEKIQSILDQITQIFSNCKKFFDLNASEYYEDDLVNFDEYSLRIHTIFDICKLFKSDDNSPLFLSDLIPTLSATLSNYFEELLKYLTPSFQSFLRSIVTKIANHLQPSENFDFSIDKVSEITDNILKIDDYKQFIEQFDHHLNISEQICSRKMQISILHNRKRILNSQKIQSTKSLFYYQIFNEDFLLSSITQNDALYREKEFLLSPIMEIFATEINNLTSSEDSLLQLDQSITDLEQQILLISPISSQANFKEKFNSRVQNFSKKEKEIRSFISLAVAVLEFEANRFHLSAKYQLLDKNNLAQIHIYSLKFKELKTEKDQYEILLNARNSSTMKVKSYTSELKDIQKQMKDINVQLKIIQQERPSTRTQLKRVFSNYEELVIKDRELTKELTPLISSIVKTSEQVPIARDIFELSKSLQVNQQLFTSSHSSLVNLLKPLIQFFNNENDNGIIPSNIFNQNIIEQIQSVDFKKLVTIIGSLYSQYGDVIVSIDQLSKWQEEPKQEENEEDLSSNLSQSEEIVFIPKRDTTSKFIVDSAVTKKAQERNVYGLSVLKRVKAKLKGYETEYFKDKLSVKEQVNFVIEQALSIDNLCVMYEGWTPWI